MNNNTVITKAARSKMVKARAGDIVLPKIVGMSFGDGGVDSSGTVIKPDDTQSELNNELLRKEIQSHEITDETTCRYTCTLEKSELVGKEISEIGLYDEDGDIVCIKNMTRKGKDDDVEQTYILDDIF